MIYESTRKMTVKEQMAFDMGYAKARAEANRLTAERDGRCVVLPYPIGTKVYIIIRHGVLHDKIIENVVCGYSESEWQGSINKGKDSRFVICHNSYNMPNAYELRDVFLTREAAEAALAILLKKGKTSQGPEPGEEEA